jgi:hypothetical protein
MKMKLFAVAAVSLALSSPLAFAQTSEAISPQTPDPGITSSTGSTGGEDTAAYLAGPNIREFFTSNNGSTLRPQMQVKEIYGKMSSAERTRLRAACAGNTDARYSELCSSVGTM